MKRLYSIKALVLFCALAILASEFGLRLTGITDFPIYESDSSIGYIPAPNQNGVFLNKNYWHINSKSQGSPEWAPNIRPDLLVIGDSVVWGGNPLNDPDKLGYQLQELMPDYSIWSASAGSWSILNTIAYLDRFPEIQEHLDHIVWVLNTGDFADKSLWKLETTHPHQRPTSALLYCLQKYLFPRIIPTAKQPEAIETLPSIEAATLATLHSKILELKSIHPDIQFTFVIYTGKAMLSGLADSRQIELQNAMEKQVDKWFSSEASIIHAYKNPDWNATLYRDSIHPSVLGYKVLAQIIKDAVISLP